MFPQVFEFRATELDVPKVFSYKYKTRAIGFGTKKKRENKTKHSGPCGFLLHPTHQANLASTPSTLWSQGLSLQVPWRLEEEKEAQQ